MLNKADGFRCIGEHASAEAALEKLPNEKPEVVLMDINLPGMNGVECVQKLKQTAPKILAVMLTAIEDTENTAASLPARAPPVTFLNARPAPKYLTPFAKSSAAARP